MNRIKRVLCTTLASALAFGLLLTGCGDKGTAQTETSISKTTAGATTAVEAPKLEPVELIWNYPGAYPLKDQDEVFTEANKIIKDKINATVNFMATNWGEYEDKMKVIMASGEDYDLCFTSNWFNNYNQAVAKGAYLPLDELFTKYAPRLYASVPARFWDATKVNGKIYGIINYQICARATPIGMTKKLADDFGFDLDKMDLLNHIENVEPYLEAVKQKRQDLIPTIVTWDDMATYYAQESLVGTKVPGAINLNEDSLKVFNQFEAPQFKKYIELMKSWEDKGYLHGKELISIKDLTPLYNQNKFAGGVGGTYKPGVEAEQLANRGEAAYIRPISDAFVTTGGITATMHAISRGSKNSERAMMLMELMNTDIPLYNLIALGREGKDYKKLEDGTVEVLKDAGYNPGTQWLHASTFNSYVLKGQPLDVWEQTKKLNESAKVSPALGFNFNPDPVKKEIAQCSAIVDEYIKGFQFGLSDIEKDYAAFIGKLDKAGAKTIVEELQKQIDQWKTTK